MSASETGETPFVRLLPTLILFALVVALGVQAMGQFSALQDAANKQLGLTDFQLTLVQGLGTAIPMLLLSIPIGILVDRTNRLRLMIVLTSIWTAGSIGTAFSNDLGMLLASRMAAGVGATGAMTCAISLAADICTPGQRGRAMLVLTVGKVLGQAAVFTVGVTLFAMIGESGLWGLEAWRGVHLIVGLVSAALIAALFLLREPPRREMLAGPGAPFRTVVSELWTRRGFLIPLFVGQIAVTMADASAGILIAPVLSRSYGMAAEQTQWIGTVLFLTGLAGSIIGGIAADAGHRRGRGGVLIGAVIFSALGVPAGLYTVAPDVTWLGIGFGVLILCGTITGLITAIAITVLLPNELRGLCIGAFLTLAGLIGFGVAPPLIGAISDAMGEGGRHLGTATAWVSVIVGAISCVAFWMAMRRAPASATAEPV
ncbi:MFS transporter [Sphingomonas sp. AOB5]|uniref:MFS transporter n=1 Tax=Sphingomonas sp. AOB5 TaxID=3034017 RepID=UPI0023F67367|nr:MFS transporter [Sphingomonas sp. AOB5]MDF7775792.1 MFS transporter [Sphingomonas sp. AOB5]